MRLALPEAERARVSLLPQRDCYDGERWQRQVQRGTVKRSKPLRKSEQAGEPPAAGQLLHARKTRA